MATFIEEIGKIINSAIGIEEKYHAIEKCYQENLRVNVATTKTQTGAVKSEPVQAKNEVKEQNKG